MIRTDLSEMWLNLCDEDLVLFERLRSKCRPLSELGLYLGAGIRSGCDKAFLIDGKKREELIQKNEINSRLIYPIAKGADVSKYEMKDKDRFIIIPIKDMTGHEAVLEHLFLFKDALDKRDDQTNNWYEIRGFTFNHWFDQPKIFFQVIAQKQSFYLDLGNYRSVSTLGFITGGDLDFLFFLLGYFNSDVFESFYRKFFTGILLGKRGYRREITYFKSVLIPNYSAEISKRAKILNTYGPNSLLEKEIDELVMGLL